VHLDGALVRTESIRPEASPGCRTTQNDREAGARARRDSNRRGGSVERLPTERCNGDCCTRRRSVHDPEFLTSHIGAVGESDRASRYWMFAIM
jgi:hypothetical protein